MSVAEKLTTIAENQQKVYDAGKNEMNLAWWKAKTRNYQSRLQYAFFFMDFEHLGGFNPPQKLIPTESNNMFYEADGITKISADQLDTSNSTKVTNMFMYSDVKEIEELNCTKAIALNYLFYSCQSLVTIEKLILRDDGTNIFTTDTFGVCTKLTNITIEGVIGNSIYFGWCRKLSVASMKNIINALADYSAENTLTYKVTFPSACWTALEADSTAPDGGTWKDYVYNVKGWNY